MSKLKDNVGEGWFNMLEPILKEDEFIKHWEQVKADYKSMTCYPNSSNIFKAFEQVKLDDVRVVLIGQD